MLTGLKFEESKLVLNSDDRQALRAAFENLAADPELAAALGQRGKAHVRDIFDKQRNVSLLEGVYYAMG